MLPGWDVLPPAQVISTIESQRFRKPPVRLEFLRQKAANAGMETPPERHPGYQSWPPPGLLNPAPWGTAPWRIVVSRGLMGRCPNCGSGKTFDGYLKVHPLCSHCSAPLGDMPADDAPPYVAMLVVLHALAILVLIFYKGIYQPSLALMLVLLVLLTGICMAALRLAKGAIIAIMLKLGMKREVLNG